jgi:hypothetical protein
MAVGYKNKHLVSIRERSHFPGASQAGSLSISTALKNVSDTVDQLIVDVDHGQAKKDCSEAVRDIDHLILRLQAIREAL